MEIEISGHFATRRRLESDPVCKRLTSTRTRRGIWECSGDCFGVETRRSYMQLATTAYEVMFRIGLRHKPVLRDRLFFGVLAGAFAHGTYLAGEPPPGGSRTGRRRLRAEAAAPAPAPPNVLPQEKCRLPPFESELLIGPNPGSNIFVAVSVKRNMYS
ncbi:hypothetical protein KSP39_PZI013179 [Platanthera zijinensis]|uniref:Uncharacterized protein n=1 Tax=Platanthera zijinensis TaxID=2320716 RepID=A0AAP0G375_9ASPA